MKSVVKLQNVPETLDMYELMAIKGGKDKDIVICIGVSAIKCTVKGSGIIVEKL